MLSAEGEVAEEEAAAKLVENHLESVHLQSKHAEHAVSKGHCIFCTAAATHKKVQKHSANYALEKVLLSPPALAWLQLASTSGEEASLRRELDLTTLECRRLEKEVKREQARHAWCTCINCTARTAVI